MQTSYRDKRLVPHGCPRCSGDLLREEEGYACLQCGRVALRLNDRFVLQTELRAAQRLPANDLSEVAEKENADVAA